MVSLRLIVLAAAIAAAVSTPPSPRTPGIVVDAATRALLKQKKADADEACKHHLIPSNGKQQSTCDGDLCFAQVFGAIDKDGRYVVSGAVELLMVSADGKLGREHANQTATLCKDSLNEHIVEGCARVKQVGECLNTELNKVLAGLYM